MAFVLSYPTLVCKADSVCLLSLFAALEAKVNLLEANVHKQDGRLTLVENSISKSGGIRQNDLDTHQPKSGDVVVNIDRMEENSADQSNTDGMAVSFVDEQDCGFFGKRSDFGRSQYCY